MATKITVSPSIYCLSKNSKNFPFQDSCSTSLPLIKGQRKINCCVQFEAKHGIYTYNYRSVCRRSKFKVKASASGDSPSSSWKKWILGVLLTVILPALGHKGGLFVALRSKIDAAVKTVETVVELVEEVAEEVEKVAEEVEEKLPQDSKLKEALESVDNLAKKAVNEVKHAEELVHKVEDVEEMIEDAIEEALMKANSHGHGTKQDGQTINSKSQDSPDGLTVHSKSQDSSATT